MSRNIVDYAKSWDFARRNLVTWKKDDFSAANHDSLVIAYVLQVKFLLPRQFLPRGQVYFGGYTFRYLYVTGRAKLSYETQILAANSFFHVTLTRVDTRLSHVRGMTEARVEFFKHLRLSSIHSRSVGRLLINEVP